MSFKFPINSFILNKITILKFYNSFISIQVNRLSMDIQIDYFNITRKEMDKLLGASQARDYLHKNSIFSITVGSNDFLNNYLLPVVSMGARIKQAPDAFVDDMINHLRAQLTVRIRHLINLHRATKKGTYCMYKMTSSI